MDVMDVCNLKAGIEFQKDTKSVDIFLQIDINQMLTNSRWYDMSEWGLLS